jgi:hypothetical protein
VAVLPLSASEYSSLSPSGDLARPVNARPGSAQKSGVFDAGMAYDTSPQNWSTELPAFPPYFCLLD